MGEGTKELLNRYDEMIAPYLVDKCSPPTSWYEENIEPHIRPLVRLLRDNGFNTVSSCQHTGIVIMDWYLDEDASQLVGVLRENGYEEFHIKCDIDIYNGYMRDRRMILKVPKEYLGG